MSLGSVAAGSSEAGSYRAGGTTGLAVAATCKRMKVFSRLDPGRGIVTLDAKELSRWLISKRNYDIAPTGSSSGGGGGGSAGGSMPGGGEGGVDRGEPPVTGRAAPSMMTLPDAPVVDGGAAGRSIGVSRSGKRDSDEKRPIEASDSAASLSLDDDSMDAPLPLARGIAAARREPQLLQQPPGPAPARQRRVYRQRQPSPEVASAGGEGSGGVNGSVNIAGSIPHALAAANGGGGVSAAANALHMGEAPPSSVPSSAPLPPVLSPLLPSQ